MNQTWHRVYVISFIVVSVSVTLLLGINGYQYYTTPLETRFFQSQYQLLRPSGLWGHAFGIIGSLMMIFGVAIYMIRKRARRLFTFGYLKHWLEFHIFLCTLGPIFVLYHTAFKFGGIVAVSFWSMVAVVLSGVIGRFIYVRIPRTIQGQELSMKQLDEMDEELTLKLRSEKSISESLLMELDNLASPHKYKHIKFLPSMKLVFNEYIAHKRILFRLSRVVRKAGVTKRRKKEIVGAAKSKLTIARRIGLLRTMQKFFKYWHIVHLPFAITMFVIMFIHVGVTIAFGYKWIF